MTHRRVAPWWIRILIRLLPKHFRDRFGAELAHVIASRPARAWREAGSLLLLAVQLRPASGNVVQLDWRASARYLLRSRATSAAIVLTLAAGFAAALITLGLGRSILWRPLPFADPDRLVFAWELATRNGLPTATRVTPARFDAWARTPGLFDGAAAFGAAGLSVDTGAGRRAVHGLRVTTEYFDVLGVRPIAGRGFNRSDETSGPVRSIVLSQQLWSEQFGENRDVIGKPARFGDATFLVVGVMPPVVTPGWPSNPAVVSLEPSQREFWVLVDGRQFAANTRSHVFGVVGRMAAGRSIDQTNLALAGEKLDAPDTHAGRVTPLREQFVRDARGPLAVLLAAAFALLLITGANLAGLQASQFERRRAEFAVRAALGAPLSRLVQQLATESLLLSAIGAGLALAAARAVLLWLPAHLPPSVPLLTPPGLDAGMWWAAAALGAVSAIVLSAWPALRIARSAPAPRGVALRGRAGIFRALVIAQVAVAVGLVSAGLLLGRSLERIYSQNAGFDIDRLLTADVAIPSTGATTASVVARMNEIMAAVAQQPGIASVAIAYDDPLTANWMQGVRFVGDAPDPPGSTREAELRIVSPTYFRTAGVEVVDGRAFTDDDGLARPGVAMINEAMARTITGSAIGRHIDAGSPGSRGPTAPPDFEIVGVVEDERFRGLEAPSRPAIYMSTGQFPQIGVSLIARTVGRPALAAPVLRTAVNRAAPTATVDHITPLSQILASQLAMRRVTTAVVGGFAAGAIALAGLGLFGLMAISVDDRRREFALRVALGASSRSLATSVVASGLRTTAIGIGAGIALSLFSSRLVASLLVGLRPSDPLTLVAVATVLLLVTAAATLVPALRAARVDPAAALKGE